MTAWVAEFVVDVTDWGIPTGDLLAAARDGLPGALASIGLDLAGGASVGLDLAGGASVGLADEQCRIRVRALVCDAEPRPDRQRKHAPVVPVVKPKPARRRSRHWRHMVEVNAKAREIRAKENIEYS